MLIRDGLIMDMIAIILKYINMIWTLNCAYIEFFYDICAVLLYQG